MAFDTTVIDDNTEVVTTNNETPETEVPEETPEPAETASTDDTEEQGESGENEETEQSDESESTEKKGRASDRIRELNAKAKAEAERAARLEAELEQMRQNKQQPKSQSSNDGSPQPPSVDDYDLNTEQGLDDYFKAQSEYENQKSEWEFDQKLAKREQVKLQQQREQEIVNQFNDRFSKNPEFRQNFEQLGELMQDKPIQADPSHLYQGDDLMDVLEEVAASPDLYYEIASLPVQAQYAKFGEIQASIKARKTTPNVSRQSKAPKPPNHTKSNAPINRSEYEKSDDDFLAARGL